MLHFQLAVGVLVDGQRVDDAHRVACAEPLEFGGAGEETVWGGRSLQVAGAEDLPALAVVC